MTDFILIHGDKANFIPSFGLATVAVRPGDMIGSGPATFDGKRICLEGDESRLSVPGCLYFTPQYSIPGSGTLKIATLAGNQKAGKIKAGDKAVLLKGGNFTARFEVQFPAQQPPTGPNPPIPDPTPQYSGSGMFITANFKFQGT
jgi:hypothetical protein